MPVLVFICAAIVFGSLYLAAFCFGFLMGKRKYDPLKGKNPEKMTVQEIYDTMTDPQKIVCSYLVGEAMKKEASMISYEDLETELRKIF